MTTCAPVSCVSSRVAAACVAAAVMAGAPEEGALSVLIGLLRPRQSIPTAAIGGGITSRSLPEGQWQAACGRKPRSRLSQPQQVEYLGPLIPGGANLSLAQVQSLMAEIGSLADLMAVAEHEGEDVWGLGSTRTRSSSPTWTEERGCLVLSGRCRHAAAGRPGAPLRPPAALRLPLGRDRRGPDGGRRPGRAGDPARGRTAGGARRAEAAGPGARVRRQAACVARRSCAAVPGPMALEHRTGRGRTAPS